MVDFISQKQRGTARPGGIAVAALALALAGCSGTTYGTGTSPGVQTMQDLAGIALFSGPKRAAINYQPRPKVVLPPSAAQLPEPGADQTASTDTPPNWPHDPGDAAARIKADAAAREKSGAPLPALQLPAGALADSGPTRDIDPVRTNTDPARTNNTPLNAEDRAKVKKLFADARGTMAVDSNGQPVRQYLTDPPASYRTPDPNAPLEFDATSKKKKFHWFWQKDDSN